MEKEHASPAIRWGSMSQTINVVRGGRENRRVAEGRANKKVGYESGRGNPTELEVNRAGRCGEVIGGGVEQGT